MGYMGFGMRKEVYTRKPKTAFKKVKQLYDQEFKKNGLEYKYANCDAETLQRIRTKIKRQKTKSFWVRAFLLIIISTSLFYTSLRLFQRQIENTAINKDFDQKRYFKTIIYQIDDDHKLKVEYFKFGPKSAETHLKGELKHQNSESYYESGEQFRSAAYFYDSLIIEVYFYKNGDTIKNFPRITDNDVHLLTLQLPDQEKYAKFTFYDGKILTGSYGEYDTK